MGPDPKNVEQSRKRHHGNYDRNGFVEAENGRPGKVGEPVGAKTRRGR